ncbi:MAG: DCL family protein [Luteolibacter sp.]|uniref:DCL family protein n=1 Tax=Luteolibacter sp. TaxID=1962973 RepID=UPI003264A30C
MPAKPISFGDLHFEKKGDAAAFLQAMLHKYDVGDKVSSDDGSILRAALANHPRAEDKIGCGIIHFSVRSADYGTKCFWVNRTDGSTEKFAHRACVYG